MVFHYSFQVKQPEPKIFRAQYLSLGFFDDEEAEFTALQMDPEEVHTIKLKKANLLDVMPSYEHSEQMLVQMLPFDHTVKLCGLNGELICTGDMIKRNCLSQNLNDIIIK